MVANQSFLLLRFTGRIKTLVRDELLETELLGTISWNSRLSLTNCYRMRRAELGCTSKINLIRNTPLSRPLLIWIVSLATISLSPLFLSLSLFLEVYGEFVFIWLSHYSTLTRNLKICPAIHSYTHAQEWLRDPCWEIESFNYANEEHGANYRGDVLVSAQYSNQRH